MRCAHSPRRCSLSLLVAFGRVAQSGPIKVGVGLALTGAGAAPARCCSTALELWRDDVNAKGGLLGRPVELVIYDDQSTPSNVPGIYTKLITVDKVDLLLGPYGTNFVAPAMPTIIQHNKMTISFTAIGINRHFNYPKYFSMVSVGPEGVNSFSIGFFELAAAQNPKPQTVAILAADAEFARSASDGAREEAKKHGFRIVYDQSYPPATTDFSPMVRAMQAANADIVYIGAYPPDNVGIIRAANEIGLTPKMFGGAMIGMLITPIKVQLGPIANGLVIVETFVPSPKLQFPGLDILMQRYQAKAAELRDRSARLRLRAVRLRGGPGAGPGGDARPRASITTSSPTTCTRTASRRWSAMSRSPRTANGRSRASSRRSSRTSSRTISISSATAQAADPVAAGVQDRQHHLSLRRRAEEIERHRLTADRDEPLQRARSRMRQRASPERRAISFVTCA